MKSQQLIKTAGTVVILSVIVMGGMLIRSPRVHADDNDQQAKIRIGFQIAPVKLNLAGKDPALVGLGSSARSSIREPTWVGERTSVRWGRSRLLRTLLLAT